MLRRRRQSADDRASSGDPPTHLIVGLGNPGPRYEGTRHNTGFMVARELVRLLPEGAERKRFQAAYVETRREDGRVVVALPETFMNDSGLAVTQLARWYRVPPARILVIYDELDLPFGTLRLRENGSDGGHNGMTSIIQHLGTQAFPRLRVGISRPRSGSTVPYVLSRFNATEQREVPTVMQAAAQAALAWLDEGTISAMNQYNRNVLAPPPAPKSSSADGTQDAPIPGV